MNVTKTDQKIASPDLVGTIASIQYPAVAEIKYDGEFNLLFVNQEVEGEKQTFLVNQNGKIRTDCSITKVASTLPCSGVFVGELYFGEGKLNAIYSLTSNAESDDLKFIIFDILELDDKIVDDDLLNRKEIIADLMIDLRDEHLQQIRIKVIESREELDVIFKQVVAAGYEGIVVKNINSRFTPSKCTWTKMKRKDIGEFKITKIEQAEERIEIDATGVSVGVKCLNRWKSSLSIGDTVVVEYQGKTDSGSLRNPVLRGRNNGKETVLF